MTLSIEALEKGIEILVSYQKLQKPNFTLEGDDLKRVIKNWSDYFSKYGITDDFFIKGCDKIVCESNRFPTALEIVEVIKTLYESYDPSNLRKFIKAYIVGYQPYRNEDFKQLSPEQRKEMAVWEDRYDTVYLELDRILRKYHEIHLVNPDLKTIGEKILTRTVCAEVLQRFDFIDTEKILNGGKSNQICGK